MASTAQSATSSGSIVITSYSIHYTKLYDALPTPPEHRFFLVFEWNDEHAETTQRLADWIKSGQLKYRESVAEGLDEAVAAFRVV